ncbi:MAG TPA: O-antigen ligase family protein, partial [Solirubrobacterales bacterium]|nr:O-antigen ligase family protein [Solirubrobacterales bacterium]
LLPPSRRRAGLMVLAMALFPILIFGDQWHGAQIVDLRHHPGRIVVLAVLGAAVVGALAYAFGRWPRLLPLAIVFAVPFRVPLHAGGESANLLVPLYLVIAAGVVAAAVRDWGVPGAWRQRSAFWLPRVLALVVLLYALQALYSEDFSKALQNVCFFLVPFTIAYALLRDVEWSPALLRAVLVLLGVEAALFVLVGSVELASRSLFWNDQIIRSNEFHTYFRVNSVFWDPNVYGRYLALATVIATAALLWTRARRPFLALSVLIVVLWIGLVPTYSQSSFIALLAGLAVLAAIRWSRRWTLAAVAVGLVGAVLVVTLVGSGDTSLSHIVKRINVDTSGRANLVEGGTDLFAERPLQGYGSGSFQHAYAAHRANKDLPVTASHTEPVTVAAEQGLVGLVAYLALVVVALGTMGRGMWAGGPEAGLAGRAARAAVLAAFVALLVHTLAYAGFFEDPITWVLLAIGVSLAPAAAPAVRLRA